MKTNQIFLFSLFLSSSALSVAGCGDDMGTAPSGSDAGPQATQDASQDAVVDSQSSTDAGTDSGSAKLAQAETFLNEIDRVVMAFCQCEDDPAECAASIDDYPHGLSMVDRTCVAGVLAESYPDDVACWAEVFEAAAVCLAEAVCETRDDLDALLRECLGNVGRSCSAAPRDPPFRDEAFNQAVQDRCAPGS